MIKTYAGKKHIEYICSKISKACGALARLRHCVNTEIMKNVYHALVHSYIRYGILVWGNASESALKPLQTVVNKILRIMTFAPYGNINLQPIYDYLKVLNIYKIFQMESGKFLYKFYNNEIIPTIGGFFETDPFANQHSYGLRSRSANVPTRLVKQTKSSEKSLQIRGPKLWRSIPDDISSSESFSIFKRAFKEYLLTNNLS